MSAKTDMKKVNHRFIEKNRMKKIKLTVDGIVRYNGRKDSYGIENAGNTGIFLRNGESLWEEKKTY